MIQSVLRNLVSNAVKFTYKRGTIVISAQKKEDNYIYFSVADNGTGIDKDTIDKLFKIDTKVGKPGTEGELSTGIGLLLCKEFVKNITEISGFKVKKIRDLYFVLLFHKQKLISIIIRQSMRLFQNFCMYQVQYQYPAH
jgi:K+-sensing histidine kinase KdpD